MKVPTYTSKASTAGLTPQRRPQTRAPFRAMGPSQQGGATAVPFIAGKIADTALKGIDIYQAFQRRKEQEEQETAALEGMQASLALSEKMRGQIYDPESGFMSRRGLSARGMTREASEWFDQNAQEIWDGLSSDRSKMMFAEKAMARKDALLTSLAKQEYTEYEAGKKERTAAYLSELGDALALGQIDVTQAQADVFSTLRELSHGKDEAVIRAQARESLTGIYGEAVARMAVDNPAGALEFLKGVAPEMDQTAVAKSMAGLNDQIYKLAKRREAEAKSYVAQAEAMTAKQKKEITLKYKNQWASGAHEQTRADIENDPDLSDWDKYELTKALDKAINVDAPRVVAKMDTDILQVSTPEGAEAFKDSVNFLRLSGLSNETANKYIAAADKKIDAINKGEDVGIASGEITKAKKRMEDRLGDDDPDVLYELEDMFLAEAKARGVTTPLALNKLADEVVNLYREEKDSEPGFFSRLGNALVPPPGYESVVPKSGAEILNKVQNQPQDGPAGQTQEAPKKQAQPTGQEYTKEDMDFLRARIAGADSRLRMEQITDDYIQSIIQARPDWVKYQFQTLGGER